MSHKSFGHELRGTLMLGEGICWLVMALASTVLAIVIVANTGRETIWTDAGAMLGALAFADYAARLSKRTLQELDGHEGRAEVSEGGKHG